MKTPLYIATALVAGSLASNAYAAPYRPVAPLTDATVANTITVTGHAEEHVKPDIAYANLQVITQDKDQQIAVSTNSAHAHDVINALHASLIADKDIETESYTVQPVYDYQASPAVLTGYQVINSIKVTLHDVSKAGLIVDKATDAGATAVDGVQFDLADESRAQGLALIDAVRNARIKADLIAGAAGVDLGRVLSISEGTAPTIQPVMFNMRMAAPAAQTTPIQSQDIDITADVTVSYAIDYSH